MSDAPSPGPAHRESQALKAWAIVEVAVAGLWFLAVAHGASNVAPDSILVLLLAPVALMLAASAFVRLVFLSYTSRRMTVAAFWPRFARWCVTPAIGCLAIAMTMTDRDLIARTALSQPALEDAARRALDGASEPPAGRIVGFFHIRSTQTHRGAVRFVTAYPSIGFDEAGLYYAPDAPPSDEYEWPGDQQIEHLFGPWYSFYWHE